MDDWVLYILSKICYKLKTSRYLYVGFMCHQAVEKALKGLLVLRKPQEELPCIHKLAWLANLSGISSEMTEEQLSLLDLLSPLNIEARYPMYKERLLASLSEDKCRELIEETEALLLWLKSKC